MKELKLKAWDKVTKEIVPVWGIEWKGWDGINGGINLIKIELDGVVERSEHEVDLIEFTGMQDINKADVFIGDYFDTDDGLMEVYFIDGKFILMWADTGTYRCDLCDAVSKLSKCGNKYENPELLAS
jgi:hypothetical protein